MITLADTKIKRIIFYWAPFILYSLLIVYLSHQPHIDLGPIEASDKVLHFLEFFGYSFLLLRLLNVCQVKNSAFWTISISTLYGISDEIHQFFITGRDCSLGDVVVDIFGAVTLVVIYLLLKKVFSLRSV